MRIMTYFLLTFILILSFTSWQMSKDTQAPRKQIEKAKQAVSLLQEEYKVLSKYKEEKGIPLSSLYLEVFNDIREACTYYGAPCEIKIIGAKDFVDTQSFFKASEYKGVKSADVKCQITLSSANDADLTGIIYKIIRFNPIEIVEARIEKNILNLTLRLYGL